MTSDHVKGLVEREIAEWRAPVVELGATLGVPWDAARYGPHIAALKAALVVPFLQRFRLRETYEQTDARHPPEATYWVIAVTPNTILWFDEKAREFGLAAPARPGDLPESIGVRGDIVGSFAAR